MNWETQENTQGSASLPPTIDSNSHRMNHEVSSGPSISKLRRAGILKRAASANGSILALRLEWLESGAVYNLWSNAQSVLQPVEPSLACHFKKPHKAPMLTIAVFIFYGFSLSNDHYLSIDVTIYRSIESICRSVDVVYLYAHLLQIIHVPKLVALVAFWALLNFEWKNDPYWIP